jgi:hypothetical protein
MTEHEDPSSDRLKQHFAQRVINQARQLLEVWQRLQRSEWNDSGMRELVQANQLLQRYAERFEQAEHGQLAGEIGHCLEQVASNRSRLNSELISQLNLLMQRLSRTGLRHGDRFEQTVLPPLRKPVYLALQHLDQAEQLAQRLEFFGMTALPFDSANAFRDAVLERHPAAILMDVDFSGPGCGLQLAQAVQ